MRKRIQSKHNAKQHTSGPKIQQSRTYISKNPQAPFQNHNQRPLSTDVI